MPGTLRASWEATTVHCDPLWTSTAPSCPSRPGRGAFLEANLSSRSTAFFNIPGINKGIDEDQRTEYGEPFIGNTDAGTVIGPANIMSMGKKSLQGFLKKRLQKAVVDELEMDVNAADLDPLTDNAEAYAVSAQTAAWKATRAAEQSLPREAGLDRIPAKVDYAWNAALQATRMAHSQRLVDQQLNITRQDRRQVSAAVDELVGNIADAVEQKDPVQQGVAVEAVKRNLAMVQDLQDTVEEDFDKLEKEQKLLEAELQEAQKYPLYPSRDYVVASVPEPGEPPPPEIVIGTMDTDVPKVEET